MRVIWKDSVIKTYNPVKYCGYVVCGSELGWTTNVEGDDNIYKTHYDAKNAIDKHLGGTGQKGCTKRKGYGITIVGKKNSETA